jgi:hypothetical protein
VWNSTTVVPGAASLFFVNGDGWALTCKHVVQQLAFADQLLTRFNNFKAERAQLKPNQKGKLQQLESKYGYKRGEPVEIYSNFIDCIEGTLNLNWFAHATLDVALLKFNNFTRLSVTSFPVFAQNGQDLKQGCLSSDDKRQLAKRETKNSEAYCVLR